MLFNKLSLHDEIAYLFKIGATVASGHRMLHVLGFEGLFYGNDNTNLSLFIGLIPLLCIGICGGLMVNLFKIRNRVF